MKKMMIEKIRLESKGTNVKILKNGIKVGFNKFEPPESIGVVILSQNVQKTL